MLEVAQVNCFGKDHRVLESDAFCLDQEKYLDQLKLKVDVLKDLLVNELSIDFRLESRIEKWRASDYTWKNTEKGEIVLSQYSPKIVWLENAHKVLANSNQGAWELLEKENLLRWHLIHPDLSPTFTYNAQDQREWHHEFSIEKDTSFEIGFFWTKGKVPEWSRTPLGFLPTVCFTDHCDFDSPVLLEAQRKLFNEAGLKTTKGVFLYDHSHRPFVASLEHEGMINEFKNWEKDGHELAYHAFSKSEGPESKRHFDSFQSPQPLSSIETYIDHGFLSYNASQKPASSMSDWYSHMGDRGIKSNWNYVDSFEATAISNNQLAPFDSSIKSLLNSVSFHKSHGLPESKSRVFKSWLSFGTKEELEFLFKQLNGAYYKFRDIGFAEFYPFLKILAKSGISLFSPYVLQRNTFDRALPIHFAKFSPLFFRSPLEKDNKVLTFQTASVKNYETVFSSVSLDKLEREKGVLIAHTYFSYTGGNHVGRLFLDENATPNDNAFKNVKDLGTRVKEKKFWNPTLKEMRNFYEQIAGISIEKVGDTLTILNAPGEVRWID